MLRDLTIKAEENLAWIERERSPAPSSDANVVRFIDLFSGCGGMSYGIVEAAHKNNFKATCVLAVELNKVPLEVYRDNIPFENDAIINDDITNVFQSSPKQPHSQLELDLLKKVGNVDVLVAGPPCQGHSDLNNSTRRNDPRNKLYLSCIRAVELFQPELVIIENVPSVIHSSEGVVQITEDQLLEFGYKVRQLRVNFLDLGVPQSRKRHVLIASKHHNFCGSIIAAESNTQCPAIKKFIAGIGQGSGLMYQSGKLSEDNRNRVNILFENDLFDLPNKYRPPCHRNKQHSYNSVYGRLHWEKPAQTLTSGYGSMGQGRYIHPEEKRTINSQEAARIQGFPDNFCFSSVRRITELREMIANAVPPQLTYKLTDLFFNKDDNIN